jgi:acyl dehydratase
VPRLHNAQDERFGGYFDDYEVGDRFRHWPAKTVTEADDHLFCLLTMAASPLHIDRVYGASTIYGQNVVVGSYIYSLLLGMSVPDISGRALANLGTDDLRHIAPVFHGDTLYGESEITDLRPSSSRPDRGILKVRTEGYTQDRKLVCTFQRAVLLPMRGSEGAP